MVDSMVGEKLIRSTITTKPQIWRALQTLKRIKALQVTGRIPSASAVIERLVERELARVDAEKAGEAHAS